jgi:hypothetical protein
MFVAGIGRCPSGDDPFTAEDETNCHRRSQLPTNRKYLFKAISTCMF